MKPIFYFCCQTQDLIQNQEGEWDFQWSHEEPQLGTVVSMGSEVRWCIVKITTYRSETAQDVDHVYVAHVHPLGHPIPPESEWNDNLEFDGKQSVYAEVVGIGQEELGSGMQRGVKTPNIGEEIESIIEPTEAGTNVLDAPKIWTTSKVASYIPISEIRMANPKTAIFAKAFLCWCKPADASNP